MENQNHNHYEMATGKENEVAVNQIAELSSKVRTFDLDSELPDLNDAIEVPINLVPEYWSPEQGEVRRMFFQSISMRPFKENNGNGIVDLPTASFIEVKKGRGVTVLQASKLLVSAIQNLNVERGTPIQIMFLGKQKNSTNANFSDRWEVTLLYVKVNE